MNFDSNWSNLLKHCISAGFLLVEGYEQGAGLDWNALFDVDKSIEKKSYA